MPLPLIAAAAAAIGGGIMDAQGQQIANSANRQMFDASTQFNAAEAEKNRQFQQEMSGTAYQRAMADMRSAGLNPMLAYQQGSASSPSGATASAPSAPTMQNEQGKLGAAIASSAKDNVVLQQAQKSVDSQSELNTTNKMLAEQKRQTEIHSASIEAANAKKAKNEAEISDAGLAARKKVEPYMPYIEAAGKVTGAINSGTALFNAGQILNNIRNQNKSTINPKTTGTFDLKTGEIHPR